MKLQLYFDKIPTLKIQKIEMMTNSDGHNAMRVKYFGDRLWHTIVSFNHAKIVHLTASRYDESD